MNISSPLVFFLFRGIDTLAPSFNSGKVLCANPNKGIIIAIIEKTSLLIIVYSICNLTTFYDELLNIEIRRVAASMHEIPSFLSIPATLLNEKFVLPERMRLTY